MSRTAAALAALQNHVEANGKTIDAYLDTVKTQVELTGKTMAAAAEEALKKPVLVAQHVLIISGRQGSPTEIVEKIQSLAKKKLPISSVTLDPNTLALYVTITNSPD